MLYIQMRNSVPENLKTFLLDTAMVRLCLLGKKIQQDKVRSQSLKKMEIANCFLTSNSTQLSMLHQEH